jgi:NADPH:quinone reductase-like Zn-dependent oxidoreductase
MPITRDAWRVEQTGSLDALRLQCSTLAEPGPGEVTVSVRAAGLNFADVFACLGMYSATPPVPFTPGLEVAGVIEAVGPAETNGAPGHGPGWQPGDRVIALTRFGGYATALNAGARYVRPLPAGWSFTEGAAFPVQALTAWYALHTLAHVQSGEVVLVHSGAGGVGLNALALLRSCAARAVATVGSEPKRRILVERAHLAPEQVIVRDRRRFASQMDEALRALGASGFDVVLDGIAGAFFMPAFRRLRPEGRMVIFGASDMISSNRSVMAFNLIWLWDRVDRLNALYGPMAAVLRDPPLVGREFPFAEAPAALRFMKTGESVGKIVLGAA